MEILRERHDHHTDEQQDRDHLHRLRDLLGCIGEESRADHTQHNGYTEQQQNLLQHRQERNHQNRNVAIEADHLTVQRTPDEEVDGCYQGRKSGGDCRHRHRQLDVALRERRDEVRDVTTRTRCHQDHTQRNHRCDQRIECQRDQECHGGQSHPLQQHAQDYRFWIRKDLFEGLPLDSESDAEHHERQDDIDDHHSAFAEIDCYAVEGL